MLQQCFKHACKYAPQMLQKCCKNAQGSQICFPYFGHCLLAQVAFLFKISHPTARPLVRVVVRWLNFLAGCLSSARPCACCRSLLYFGWVVCEQKQFCVYGNSTGREGIEKLAWPVFVLSILWAFLRAALKNLRGRIIFGAFL